MIRYYARGTTIILMALWVRFAISYSELFNKYLNGQDLWEMGYEFAKTFGNHAPALNMHVSFVFLAHIHLFIKSLGRKNSWAALLNGGFAFLTLMLMLYINTRMALINSVLFMVFIVCYESWRNRIFKKYLSILGLTILTFVLIFTLFDNTFPLIKDKLTKTAFWHLDKRGKLDEIEKPNEKVHGSLVTRLSIWDGAYDVAVQSLPFGTGADDGRKTLVNYFRQKNQNYLAEYRFPVHNQYLDAFMKYGPLGLGVILLFLTYSLMLGFKLKNSLILAFAGIFITSNIFDDFLIRFDGIVFSGFWISIFASDYLKSLKNPTPSLRILKS
ncbi:MAG: O-antigen ligase family protein [Leeuwenhoekiella sp.]